MAKLAACSIAGLSSNPHHLAALCDLWRSEKRSLWLTLQGGSMTPTILPGRRVKLICSLEELVPHQVIVYRQGARLIVHRLQSTTVEADGRRRFVCMGDGNVEPDEPVDECDVLGVVSEVSSTPLALRLAFAFAHPFRHWRFLRRTYFNKSSEAGF